MRGAMFGEDGVGNMVFFDGRVPGFGGQVPCPAHPLHPTKTTQKTTPTGTLMGHILRLRPLKNPK